MNMTFGGECQIVLKCVLLYKEWCQMKRALYVIIVLWVGVTGIYMANVGKAQTVSMSSAFTDSISGREWCELDTCVEGYGKFGVCYLSDEEKERLVKNVAAALGITSPCTITTEQERRGVWDGEPGSDAVDISTVVLTKDSVSGSVTIKSITQEHLGEAGTGTSAINAEQYVYVSINVNNNIDCANSYRQLVEGMFDAMGIQGNVNMNLVGTLEGALNSDEKNELADSLLKKLDAEVVAENRDNEMFTIYAYSKGAGSYITIGGSKINMNIAIGYDEEQNATKVYLASPVNSLDY